MKRLPFWDFFLLWQLWCICSDRIKQKLFHWRFEGSHVVKKTVIGNLFSHIHSLLRITTDIQIHSENVQKTEQRKILSRQFHGEIFVKFFSKFRISLFLRIQNPSSIASVLLILAVVILHHQSTGWMSARWVQLSDRIWMSTGFGWRTYNLLHPWI